MPYSFDAVLTHGSMQTPRNHWGNGGGESCADTYSQKRASFGQAGNRMKPRDRRVCACKTIASRKICIRGPGKSQPVVRIRGPPIRRPPSGKVDLKMSPARPDGARSRAHGRFDVVGAMTIGSGKGGGRIRPALPARRQRIFVERFCGLTHIIPAGSWQESADLRPSSFPHALGGKQRLLLASAVDSPRNPETSRSGQVEAGESWRASRGGRVENEVESGRWTRQLGIAGPWGQGPGLSSPMAFPAVDMSILAVRHSRAARRILAEHRRKS